MIKGSFIQQGLLIYIFVYSWAQLYFLAWYLVSVILSINLFVALILEAFVNQWESRQQRQRDTAMSINVQVNSLFYYFQSCAMYELFS